MARKSEDKNFTPAETEFAGIVFRSKSEAMFCHWLMLTLEQSKKEKESEAAESIHPSFSACSPARFDVFYEPFGVNCFCDFLIVETTTSIIPLDETRYSVIEYKPSVPTDSFVKKWALAIQSKFAEYFWQVKPKHFIEFQIYYGNCYTSNRGFFELILSQKEKHSLGELNERQLMDRVIHFSDVNWLGEFEEEIKNHRYDLKR